MQAGVLIARAQSTLLDPAGVYWSQAELIDYLNGAISFVIGLKPDACVITGSIDLVAGVSQALPEGGVQFLQGLVNTVSGKSVLTRDLEKLNHASPNWAGAAPATDVAVVLPDNRDPTRFRVSPPNNGNGRITAMYCAMPAALGALTDEVPISDVYQTALWAYVVGMALAKNSSKQDLPKVQGMMALATALVQGKQQGALAQAQPAAIPDLTV